jgi:hypothetical protein
VYVLLFCRSFCIHHSSQGEVEIQSSDNEDALSDEEPDDRDITIRREKDQRYPTLKIQSPRVKAVLHRSFVLARGRLCFHSAYAPAEDPNRFFRQILQEAARDLRDSELAQVLKTNAAYGNALAHLVRRIVILFRLPSDV